MRGYKFLNTGSPLTRLRGGEQYKYQEKRRRRETVLVLMHYDWFGTDEELKKIEEAVKKACAETDGVEYKGRYSPLERKFHWTNIYELEDEDYGKVRKAIDRANEISGVKIDHKKLPNASVSLFSGPYHK